jgi:hypothetical protein
VDEFYNFADLSIVDSLNKLRDANLEYTLAHQSLVGVQGHPPGHDVPSPGPSPSSGRSRPTSSPAPAVGHSPRRRRHPSLHHCSGHPRAPAAPPFPSLRPPHRPSSASGELKRRACTPSPKTRPGSRPSSAGLRRPRGPARALRGSHPPLRGFPTRPPARWPAPEPRLSVLGAEQPSLVLRLRAPLLRRCAQRRPELGRRVALVACWHSDTCAGTRSLCRRSVLPGGRLRGGTSRSRE